MAPLIRELEKRDEIESIVCVTAQHRQMLDQVINTFKINTNYIGGSKLFIFSINYLLIILRMLFPIEPIPLGVKYLPYVLYQLVITFCIIKSIITFRNNSKEKNIARYLYVGFLFAPATFEPDFGSWIRHEAVLFPIISILIDMKCIKKSK